MIVLSGIFKENLSFSIAYNIAVLRYFCKGKIDLRLIKTFGSKETMDAAFAFLYTRNGKGLARDTVIISSLRFYSLCRVMADAHLFWYDIKDSGQDSLIV